MVARAGGYYGAAFKGAHGVTHGDSLSPTIFNMVVDAVVRHWVAVMVEGAEERGEYGQEGRHQNSLFYDRGSIPAKVGFWVGLRIFSYVPTPTKLTYAISKPQLSGPKKGVFSPKIPRKYPFFVFGVF